MSDNILNPFYVVSNISQEIVFEGTKKDCIDYACEHFEEYLDDFGLSVYHFSEL